jgi:serine/threonine protein kinase
MENESTKIIDNEGNGSCQSQQLQIGTTLQNGKYRIESVLGQGGFGITYLAKHTYFDKKVAIKEFFFKDFCERNSSTSHVTLGTESNRAMVNRFKQKFMTAL